MTSRRSFIKGAVAVAVAAAIPGGDGVELYSISHPVANTLVTPEEAGARMAAALAKSMRQTLEHITANNFGRQVWFEDGEFKHRDISMGEAYE